MSGTGGGLVCIIIIDIISLDHAHILLYKWRSAVAFRFAERFARETPVCRFTRLRSKPDQNECHRSARHLRACSLRISSDLQLSIGSQRPRYSIQVTDVNHGEYHSNEVSEKVNIHTYMYILFTMSFTLYLSM